MQEEATAPTRFTRVCATAMSLVLTAGTFADIQYTVTDLGPICTGLLSRALALNDLGDAAGDANPGGGLYAHAVLWSNGEVIDLTGTGISAAGASGVNNHGLVVGITDEFDLNAFTWQNGVLTQLPAPIACCSFALDVNDAGRIVGAASITQIGLYEAVYWENGEMLELGFQGEAVVVSEAGHIAGTMWVSGTEAHAFLWHNGELTDLGTLGGQFGQACDVNAANTMVGFSDLSGVDPTPFIWNGGAMTALPTLGGMFGYAYGINEAGVIVGGTYPGPFVSLRATMWVDGEPIDLNDRIDPNSPWTLTQANDINEAGQIVGQGRIGDFEHGFLLTPIEPTCPADVNGDEAVDVLDLLAVLAAWGATSGPEDINGDGQVDVLDLLQLLAAWGPCS